MQGSRPTDSNFAVSPVSSSGMPRTGMHPHVRLRALAPLFMRRLAAVEAKQ